MNGRIILHVPSRGVETDVYTPYDTYCAIYDMIENGYDFNEIEVSHG